MSQENMIQIMPVIISHSSVALEMECQTKHVALWDIVVQTMYFTYCIWHIWENRPIICQCC